jgi:hypothetical protein
MPTVAADPLLRNSRRLRFTMAPPQVDRYHTLSCAERAPLSSSAKDIQLIYHPAPRVKEKTARKAPRTGLKNHFRFAVCAEWAIIGFGQGSNY